jgi:hypothetical protein
MPELSPAAQAVRIASFFSFCEAAEKETDLDFRCAPAIAAAALEAVADQVVPFEKAPDPVPAHGQETFLRSLDLERLDQRQHTRTQLLAIAAELRGDTTTNEDN